MGASRRDLVVEGWAVMAHRDPGSNPIQVGGRIGLLRIRSDSHEEGQGLSFESASASLTCK